MLLNILHAQDSLSNEDSSGPDVNSAAVEAPWLRISKRPTIFLVSSSASENGPLINFGNRAY